jgi:hypothetical protein
MKYKFKKFWSEWRDLVFIGVGLSLLLSLFLIALLANRNAKNNQGNSTLDKGIEARSIEYKGHKYILFEKTNVFGQISVVHDPDCCK